MSVSFERSEVRPGRTLAGSDIGIPGMMWLYIVSVVDGTLFGVLFENNREDAANPRFHSAPLSSLSANPTTHDVTVVDWWPRMLAAFFQRSETNGQTGTTDTDTATAVRDAVAAERARLMSEFEAWKARATQIAHDYANNNDLCSEFDRCMEDVGLPPREREFEVEYTVTATVTYTGYATIEASSEDEAQDILNDDPERFIDVDSVKAYGYVDNVEIECA